MLLFVLFDVTIAYFSCVVIKFYRYFETKLLPLEVKEKLLVDIS